MGGSEGEKKDPPTVGGSGPILLDLRRGQVDASRPWGRVSGWVGVSAVCFLAAIWLSWPYFGGRPFPWYLFALFGLAVVLLFHGFMHGGKAAQFNVDPQHLRYRGPTLFGMEVRTWRLSEIRSIRAAETGTSVKVGAPPVELPVKRLLITLASGEEIRLLKGYDPDDVDRIALQLTRELARLNSPPPSQS